MQYTFTDNIQRGILFLTKHNKDFFSQIVPLIKPDYFEYACHSNIYQSIVEFYEEYREIPVDDFILEQCKALKTKKEQISAYEDELEYINGLKDTVVDSEDYFLDKIEEFAKKAAMKEAITTSIGHIQEDKYDLVEEEVRKALTVSRNLNLGQDYFTGVDARWQRSTEFSNEKKYETILPKLNLELEGGLSHKELAMVVAPPGVGKSLFLVNQGATSLIEGRNVLYVSLEMSEDKIAQRFDSVLSLLSQRSLPHKQTDLKTRLEIFKKEFPQGMLKIKEYPTGLAKVSTIRALLFQLRNYEGFVPDVLIVDYLELLESTRDAPEYLAQEMLARELRGLAVEQNMLVWTATQTNRCFWPGTLLYISRKEEKKLIPIENIEVGDKVYTPEGLKSVQKVYTGTQKLYTITLESGKKVTVSKNHLFPVTSDTCESLDTGLSVGDFLLVEDDD